MVVGLAAASSGGGMSKGVGTSKQSRAVAPVLFDV